MIIKHLGLYLAESNQPIKSGDWILGVFSKSIVRCVVVFDDGTLVIQFESGMRASMTTDLFKKLVPVNPTWRRVRKKAKYVDLDD